MFIGKQSFIPLSAIIAMRGDWSEKLLRCMVFFI
jgi:hypothetical protein